MFQLNNFNPEENGFISGRALQNLVERVGQQNCISGLPQIICASSLAFRGLLNISMSFKSVEDFFNVKIFLEGDLSSVPAEHLSSLVSCMPTRMHIYLGIVTGCDLISLMDSLKCSSLYFRSQIIGREETQALVRAMESRVEEVRRASCGARMTLDIMELLKYSGQGRCRYFECNEVMILDYWGRTWKGA